MTTKKEKEQNKEGLHQEKLSTLKNRISEAKGPKEKPKTNDGDHGQANLGIQIITEIIAALLVGTFFGYWLDKLFGTSPILLMLFIFIGILTGLINAYRISYGMKPLADPSLLQNVENQCKDEGAFSKEED